MEKVYGRCENKCLVEVEPKQETSDQYQIKYYNEEKATYETTTINFQRKGNMVRATIRAIITKTTGFIPLYNLDGTPFTIPEKYEPLRGYIIKLIVQDFSDGNNVLELKVTPYQAMEGETTTFDGVGVVVSGLNVPNIGVTRTYYVAKTMICDEYIAKN